MNQTKIENNWIESSLLSDLNFKKNNKTNQFGIKD